MNGFILESNYIANIDADNYPYDKDFALSVARMGITCGRYHRQNRNN